MTHNTVHVTGNDISIVWVGNGKSLHFNINTEYQRLSWAVVDPDPSGAPMCVHIGHFPAELAADLQSLGIEAKPDPQPNEDDDEHTDPGNQGPVRH